MGTKRQGGTRAPGSTTQPSSSRVPKDQSNGKRHKFIAEEEYVIDMEKLPLLPELSPERSKIVFTHQTGVVGTNPSKTDRCYDRLEFLGDAYVELFATRMLFARYPTMLVGRLSQAREMLVKNETLAKFAIAYGFDKRIKCNDEIRAQSKSNQKAWIKILGDIVEAYVAAITAEETGDGFRRAEEWLNCLWEPILSKHYPLALEAAPMDVTAKSALASKVMCKGIKLDYRDLAPPEMLQNQGKAYFTIGVFLTGWGVSDELLGTGRGLSKQEAGQNAAASASKSARVAEVAQIKQQHLEKCQRDSELNLP